MLRQEFTAIVSLFVLASCNSQDGGGTVTISTLAQSTDTSEQQESTKSDSIVGSDSLPAKWADAVPLSLEQGECEEQDIAARDDSSTDSLSLIVDGQSVNLSVFDTFRCDQDAEALAYSDEGILEILLQPINLDPETIAKCDCEYEFTMTIDDIEAGEHLLSVYHRGDNESGQSEPRLVASESFSISQ